jgi:hypothetical protein
MKIEAAYCDGKLVGHRLTTGADSILVFEERQGFPGFRLGDHFVAPFGKTISYTEMKLVQA